MYVQSGASQPTLDGSSQLRGVATHGPVQRMVQCHVLHIREVDGRVLLQLVHQLVQPREQTIAAR